MLDIVDTLRQDGVFTPATAEAVRDLTSQGRMLDDALREANGVAEDKLLKALAATLDMEFVELESRTPPKDLLDKFPARILLERHLLPLEVQNGITTIATSRAFDTTGLDELRLV